MPLRKGMAFFVLKLLSFPAKRKKQRNACSSIVHYSDRYGIYICCMEIQEMVEAWRKAGSDYNTGKLLYENYGKSNFIKRVLATGSSRSNVELLLKELRGLCSSEITTTPAVADTNNYKPKPKPIAKDPYDVLSLPPSLQEKHYLKGQLHKEAGLLRQQLRFEPKQDKRRDIIEALMAKVKHRDLLWKDLMYYCDHHAEREQPKQMDQDLTTLSVAELVKLEKQIAPALSRLKKKLLGLTGDDLTQATEIYEAQRNKLNKLRELLRS